MNFRTNCYIRDEFKEKNISLLYFFPDLIQFYTNQWDIPERNFLNKKKIYIEQSDY